MQTISIRLKQTVYILFVSIICNSCSKTWLDVNYNPLELTDSVATPDLILPELLVGGGPWYGLPGTMDIDLVLFNNWMGYWSPPQVSTTGDFSTTYKISADFWSNDNFNPSPKIDPLLLEEKAMRVGQTFYAAIAKIVKAITYSRNVDVYNNLPYSEAFKFDIRQPKYDSGQVIYESLVRELDSAIHLIKNADLNKNIRITQADIMFNGDQLKWIKLANTLKLRLLVHQANKSERSDYITSEINKILEEGSGFLGSGESAEVHPGYFIGKSNRFFEAYSKYSIYSGGRWPAASANVIALNYLKENSDPRIGYFYSPVETLLPDDAPEPFSQPSPLTFRGNKFGLPINEAVYPYQGAGYVSQIGGTTGDGPVTPASSGIIKGYDMGMWIFTSIESLFLQAEAVQRGWIPGSAEDAYKNAVKESFRWLNVGGNSTVPELSDAVFDQWYNLQESESNPNVSWPAAPDKYKLLMFQKYLAFNGIEPFEAWVDYRRNGEYPHIPLSADPNRVSDKLPVRSLYNAREYVNNTGNVKAQGEIDVFNSKIWWMP
jgi:hypothetical protein